MHVAISQKKGREIQKDLNKLKKKKTEKEEKTWRKRSFPIQESRQALLPHTSTQAPSHIDVPTLTIPGHPFPLYVTPSPFCSLPSPFATSWNPECGIIVVVLVVVVRSSVVSKLLLLFGRRKWSLFGNGPALMSLEPLN